MANQELLIQRGEIEAQAGLFDGPDVVLMVFAEPAHRAAQVFTLTSSPTLALRVTGGGFPLLGDSCSRSTGFLLHRAA